MISTRATTVASTWAKPGSKINATNQKVSANLKIIFVVVKYATISNSEKYTCKS